MREPLERAKSDAARPGRPTAAATPATTRQLLRRYYRHVAPEDLLDRKPGRRLRRRVSSHRKLAAAPPAGHRHGPGRSRPTGRRARLVGRRAHASSRSSPTTCRSSSTRSPMSSAGSGRGDPPRRSTRSFVVRRDITGAAARGVRRRAAAERGRRRACASRGCTSRSTGCPTGDELDAIDGGPAARAARRPRGRRGLAEDARAGAGRSSTSSPTHPPRARRAGGAPRPRSCCAGSPTTTSPSSATASTGSSASTATTSLRAVPGTGLGILRADQDMSGVVRQAAARRSQAKAREKTAAGAHQGQLPLDRAPPGLPRLRRRQDASTPTARSSASAASSGCSPSAAYTESVHAHPGAARARPREVLERSRLRPATATPARTCCRSSRPTRATSCSRSPVDELLPIAAGRAAPAGAPPAAAVPAPRRPTAASCPASSTCRATATPPRSAQRDGARSCSRRFDGDERRLHRAVSRVGAGPAALRRARRPRATRAARSTPAQLERRLADATRSWADDFADALSRQCGEETAARLAAAYGDAFPEAYKEDFTARPPRSPTCAGSRRLSDDGDIDLSLYDAARRRPRRARGSRSSASATRSRCPRCCRCCSAMGVEVVDERPYELERRWTAPAWIYDFGLRYEPSASCRSTTPRSCSRTRSRAVWDGDAESDGFNALVLRGRADLAAGDGAARLREVPAPGRRRRSARTTSRSALLANVRHHPAAGRSCSRRASTRPVTAGGGARRWSTGCIEEIAGALDARRQPRPGPHPALATCTLITRDAAHQLLPARRRRPAEAVHRRSSSTRSRSPTCPQPRPQFEIFVYSPAGRGRAPALRRRSPAAACAGRTAARTSAPRSSAWSRRRWSRTP